VGSSSRSKSAKTSDLRVLNCLLCRSMNTHYRSPSVGLLQTSNDAQPFRRADIQRRATFVPPLSGGSTLDPSASPHAQQSPHPAARRPARSSSGLHDHRKHERGAHYHHSVVASSDHRGMPRGFLPRGLSNTCPQAAAMRGVVSSRGQMSDNPKQEQRAAGIGRRPSIDSPKSCRRSSRFHRKRWRSLWSESKTIATDRYGSESPARRPSGSVTIVADHPCLSCLNSRVAPQPLACAA